jgi:hypothetical protein
LHNIREIDIELVHVVLNQFETKPASVGFEVRTNVKFMIKPRLSPAIPKLNVDSTGNSEVFREWDANLDG